MTEYKVQSVVAFAKTAPIEWDALDKIPTLSKLKGRATLTVRGRNVMVYRKGKLRAAGCKSIHETEDILKEAAEIISRATGQPLPIEGLDITNIVASADVGHPLDLGALVLSAPDQVEYEPEQFPGAHLRLDDPKGHLLLFTSGKIIVTGVRSIPAIDDALRRGIELLRRVGVLR